MAERRKLIVGNWKMNGSRRQLEELVPIGKAAARAESVDVAICPPAVLIAAAADRPNAVPVGAQDVHHEDKGAHTGDVSAPMLKDAGARLAIVGHSERRSDHGETDAEVRAKAEAALRHGLQAIVCVGESAGEREAGRALDVVGAQLENSLPDHCGGGELVVAYEPIWAIGTGKVATPDDVDEMHAAIRRHLVDRFGEVGEGIRILYGGSVKASNADDLFAVPDVDGALVGGASLTAADFVPIIEAAARG